MAPSPPCNPHLVPMHDGVEHPQRLVGGAVCIELGNDDRVADDQGFAQAPLQPGGWKGGVSNCGADPDGQTESRESPLNEVLGRGISGCLHRYFSQGGRGRGGRERGGRKANGLPPHGYHRPGDQPRIQQVPFLSADRPSYPVEWDSSFKVHPPPTCQGARLSPCPPVGSFCSLLALPLQLVKFGSLGLKMHQDGSSRGH